MSDFLRRLGGTVVQNLIYSTALSSIVYTTDKQYWDSPKLGYLVVFWLGAVMPIKMGQYGINKLILKRLDLPNYNFFYLYNAKALLIDMSLNHLFFPFVTITLLYNYFQYGLPNVYTPKPQTVEKFEKIRAESDSKQLIQKETKASQEILSDIVKFRIRLSVVSIFWDLMFPRFNMAKQTAKVVTDLTANGKKIQYLKNYVIGFSWHTYCIHKYFEFHH